MSRNISRQSHWQLYLSATNNFDAIFLFTDYESHVPLKTIHSCRLKIIYSVNLQKFRLLLDRSLIIRNMKQKSPNKSSNDKLGRTHRNILYYPAPQSSRFFHNFFLIDIFQAHKICNS